MLNLRITNVDQTNRRLPHYFDADESNQHQNTLTIVIDIIIQVAAEKGIKLKRPLLSLIPGNSDYFTGTENQFKEIIRRLIDETAKQAKNSD